MAVIDKDFVRLYEREDGEYKAVATLFWGDEVQVLAPEPGDSADYTRVRAPQLWHGNGTYFVRGDVPVRDDTKPGILRMSMVDVQQGDGIIIETPKTGQIITIDGGDNKLFARHMAARFWHRNTAADDRLPVDAMVITHGDGDHFDGLNDIRRSEEHRTPRKRLFIKPLRVLHNGLVKRPSSVPEKQRLGATVQVDEELYCTEFHDDPRAVDGNQYFDWWATSLDHWEEEADYEIDFRHVHADMDPGVVFDFLDDSLSVDIIGPRRTTVTNEAGEDVEGLKFFRRPKKSAVLHLEHGGSGGSLSAGQTINGHSLALRLTYNNVRFQLTGDLNHESMEHVWEALVAEHGEDGANALFEAEIVKAPHHGSHEFSLNVLKRMNPVVAMVSSGDESAMKEYIHPRATLMAALGQSMQPDVDDNGDPVDRNGLVFVTELAAFFEYKKTSYTQKALVDFFAKYDLGDDEANGGAERSFGRAELLRILEGREAERPDRFEGFERTNFGIVHVRTDGERVLVFTHSGKEGTNEAYAFTVSRDANDRRVVTFERDVKTQ